VLAAIARFPRVWVTHVGHVQFTPKVRPKYFSFFTVTAREIQTDRDVQNSHMDGPRLRGGKIGFWRLGRARSYVRPFRKRPHESRAIQCAKVKKNAPYLRYEHH